MKTKKLYALLSLYTSLMLCLLGATAIALLHTLEKVHANAPQKQTEYVTVDRTVPVFVPDRLPTEGEETGWVVKEHEGKIGIFEKDGTLFQVIPTYVKTLPEADQRLLGEGFEIETKAQLNAIWEDYSD